MTQKASVVIWGDTAAQKHIAYNLASGFAASGEEFELGEDFVDFPAFSDLAKLLPYIGEDALCEGVDGQCFKLSLQEYIDDDEHLGNNIVWVTKLHDEEIHISVMKL